MAKTMIIIVIILVVIFIFIIIICIISHVQFYGIENVDPTKADFMDQSLIPSDLDSAAGGLSILKYRLRQVLL